MEINKNDDDDDGTVGGISMAMTFQSKFTTDTRSRTL
jgi:hypothetical protein